MIAAMLHDSVVRRTRPRTMPLTKMTMKTQMPGFMSMGLLSAALRAAVELRYKPYIF